MTREQLLEISAGPMGFTEAMWRAVLEERKTNTRRVIPLDVPICSDKANYGDDPDMVWYGDYGLRPQHKPKYKVGEIYYLTEPVRITQINDLRGKVKDIDSPLSCCFEYLWKTPIRPGSRVLGNYTPKLSLSVEDYDRIMARKGPKNWKGEGWKAPTTSRFMLKSFARHFVRVTDVRIERLQDITPADCRAEGIDPKSTDVGARYCFGLLWDSISGKSADKCWDANPWVFAHTFEKVEVEG